MIMTVSLKRTLKDIKDPEGHKGPWRTFWEFVPNSDPCMGQECNCFLQRPKGSANTADVYRIGEKHSHISTRIVTESNLGTAVEQP